jgi:hypothetical protein
MGVIIQQIWSTYSLFGIYMGVVIQQIWSTYSLFRILHGCYYPTDLKHILSVRNLHGCYYPTDLKHIFSVRNFTRVNFQPIWSTFLCSEFYTGYYKTNFKNISFLQSFSRVIMQPIWNTCPHSSPDSVSKLYLMWETYTYYTGTGNATRTWCECSFRRRNMNYQSCYKELSSLMSAGYKCQWKPEGTDHLRDLGVGGTIGLILKRMFEGNVCELDSAGWG